MKSIAIDFKNIENTPILLIDSRQIKLKEEKLLNVYPKSVKAPFPKLSITELQIPESVVVKNPDELVKIRLNLYNPGTRSYQEESASEFKNFIVNNFNFPYQVILDPQQIGDYNDFSNEDQNISFKVTGEIKKGDPEAIKSIDFAVNLNFHKAQSKPIFSFELHKDFLTGFEYRKNKRVLLGHVKLKSQANFTYSDLLDCIVGVRYDKKYEEDIIFLGNLSEIKESKPSQSYTGGLIPDGEQPEFDVKKSLTPNDEIELKNILPNNDIYIPVYIDLTRIDNPMDATEHTMILTLNFNGITKTLKEKFTINQDTRTTDLSIFLKGGNSLETISLNNNSTKELEGRYQWSGSEENGQIRLFKLQLGNNAQNGEGHVAIRNLLINFEEDKNSTSTIELKGIPNNQPDLLHLFLLNGNKGDSMYGTDLTFNNGDSPLNLDCTFRHKAIKNIPNDIATVICKISFEYKTHEGTAFTSFHTNLRFKVERNPGAYWLAMDFGTSAIVSAFDNGAAKNTQLIDMQKALYELLKKKSWEDKYNEMEIEEIGGSFLSSTLLLRNKGIINASTHQDDIIYLSPLKRELNPQFKRIVPYLKSLIGTEFLPNTKNRLDNFEYKVHKVNNKFRVINGNQNLLKLEDILTNTYQSLLRDYMVPAITASGQMNSLNKVIFTVPNTFTPRHNDFIRKLIEKKFGYFKKDYIDFISESDAVACYYLANWDQFNMNRNLEDKDKLRPGVEYLLIYDMGAGTLDLTYLKVSTSSTGDKTINIIGRLGTTSAGNYLDYVIAEAIYEKSKDENDESVFTTKVLNPVLGNELDEAIKLKSAIRNKIKPSLEQDESFTYKTKDDAEIFISTKELRNDKRIKDYIKKNTSELLANFFGLFKEQAEHKKGNYPLNTVLFSGRSSQFFGIKASLKKEVMNWVNNPNVFFIDELNASELKNTVVQGALKYATTYRNNLRMNIINPNLQARYGVLYIDPIQDNWIFKELLNPATRPLKPKYESIDGVAIYEYDTDVYDADPGNDNRQNFLDLSFTSEGYFVQSYSLNTAKDWNTGQTEYISVMFKFNKDKVSSSGTAGKVPVRVVINKENEMEIEIGNSIDDPRSPLTLDINESTSFKKSMWPFWS